MLPEITAENLLRVCLFRPYLKGRGPAFVLTMWATNETGNRGQTRIAYCLTQVTPDARRDEPLMLNLFEGQDFCGSPMHADDSDETVECLIGFLTLRPGDTDSEYFDKYTPEQAAFCDAYAEDLSVAVLDRFAGPNVKANVYNETSTERGADLPAFTSLGSYTLVYRRENGEELCAACASTNARDASPVDHVQTYDEGDPLECDECDAMIESSYGPVESSETDNV
jgi:hypothetical protein